MKKTAITVLLTIMASVVSYAQGPYDAWLFSENNYEGTARSVAMGNAFTALGGDLGAVSINPASSAVARYSQISITPSLTFSTNTTIGVPYEKNTTPYFQREMKSRKSQVRIPNAGFSFNFDTGRNHGIKSISLGFVLNSTNSWCEDLYANGTNSKTSFLAALAADATDEITLLNKDRPINEPEYTKADYMNEDAFKYMNWQNTIAYRSGMISAFDTEGKRFVGATETPLEGTNGNSVIQSGKVNQTYGRTVSGNKYEYILNFGANISDFIYIGANLGITSISYDYTHYFREGAVDPDDFKNTYYDSDNNEITTYFKNALYRHTYSADGTGFFGKVGIIVTPGNGLRFGAAIQTPTATTIKEEWQDSGETTFTDSEFNGTAESEIGYNEYDFNSPWRGNFGFAYTLGKIAVLSADYEWVGWKSMRYKIYHGSMEEADIEHFENVNQEIRGTYGTEHNLRIGAEFKPISVLALRAGYNLSTAAQKKMKVYEGEDKRLIDANLPNRHNIALGIGYTSKKSFFADIACRYTFRTNEYIFPYSDYLKDHNGTLSPEIRSRHSNWKVLLTLGWRF